MSACRVSGCRGRMEGQMVACAPHWSLLPEKLRLQLVALWDVMEEQKRHGNLRRATREAWKLFLADADASWESLAATIAPLLLPSEPRREGVVWVRALRRAAEHAQADEAVAEAAEMAS